MKDLKFKSLTMRIWITFTAVILIIVMCISLVYFTIVDRYEYSSRIQDMKTVHQTLLNNTNIRNGLLGLENLNRVGFYIAHKESGEKTEIIEIMKPNIERRDLDDKNPIENRNGQRIWMASFAKDENMKEVLFEEKQFNQKYMFMISSIKIDNENGYYLISYVDSRKELPIIEIAAIVSLIFIIIGFITARLVADNISKPLKELEIYTERIAKKDWTQPLELDRADEVGRLAVAMNEMQEALKYSEKEEKLFLQSISHDLKTPVMVIMSHAQAILDGIYIESIENTANIIKEEAIRLQNKIRQILYLNSLDYSLVNNNENEEVDLEELAISVAAKLRPINNEIVWQLDTTQVRVNANSEKIRVAIENILDNQLRYADKRINITLKDAEDSALLEISNDGPIIEPEKIVHIFENFYKDKTGNFGLGLAITKRIIDFYKGTVTAENKESGVQFTIKLPKI